MALQQCRHMAQSGPVQHIQHVSQITALWFWVTRGSNMMQSHCALINLSIILNKPFSLRSAVGRTMWAHGERPFTAGPKPVQNLMQTCRHKALLLTPHYCSFMSSTRTYTDSLPSILTSSFLNFLLSHHSIMCPLALIFLCFTFPAKCSLIPIKRINGM